MRTHWTLIALAVVLAVSLSLMANCLPYPSLDDSHSAEFRSRSWDAACKVEEALQSGDLEAIDRAKKEHQKVTKEWDAYEKNRRNGNWNLFGL